MCRKKEVDTVTPIWDKVLASAAALFELQTPKDRRTKEQNYRQYYIKLTNMHSKGSNPGSKDSSCGTGRWICKLFT